MKQLGRHEERLRRFRAARDRLAAARAAPPPDDDTTALFDLTDFDPDDQKETP